MSYNVDNTATLEKILKNLEPIFKMVEAAQKLCYKVDPNNLEQVKKMEIQVTGCYMQLQEIFSRVATLKKNKELAYYMELKARIEGAGEKFVAASSDKEASLAVAEERRVRDIIEGYLLAASECIKTCRNLVNEKKYASQALQPDQE